MGMSRKVIAEGRSRTDMILLSVDFESTASAISPLRHVLNFYHEKSSAASKAGKTIKG
jgi:hypothetical protein